MSAWIDRGRPKAVLAPFRQAGRDLGAFRAAYSWLLADLIAFSRRRVAGVVALNLLGVALQWMVVGAVLLFVGELTGEGGAFQAPLLEGIELPVDGSFGMVAGWGVAVLALVASASLATYGAEAIGYETAQRYVERSGREILGATLATRSRLTDDGDPPARRLQMSLARDHIMILRALLVAQRSLRAILMVVVAAIVLALINPVLSAVVAAVATLFTVPYYLVNRRMVEAAATLERRNASARVSISRLVDHATSREPNAEVLRVVPELYPSDLAIADRWNALRDIMLGGQRTTALMGGLVGSCLVAVVVTFGLLIARDGTSWIAALTFIIALNLASAAFIQLAAQVTAANRFLPHVQEHIAFATGLAQHAAAGGNTPGQALGSLPLVRAPHPRLSGGLAKLALKPGTRTLCIYLEAIDRLNAHALLTILVGGNREEAQQLREAAFFCGDPSALPPVAVRVLLGAHGTTALARLGLVDEVARLPRGDDTLLTPELQERLSPFLRYALGVLEGIDRQLMILAWKPFARLSPEERARLLEVLAARPVLFVIAATPGRQPAEITHTIALSGHTVAGMGDAQWYKKAAPKLLAAATAQPQQVGASAGASLSDLEEM